MLRFEPPEILGKLQKAKSLLAEYLDWDWYEVDEDNFNPSGDEELADEIITPDTRTYVALAHSMHDSEDECFIVREIVELVDAFESAVLIEDTLAISDSMSVVRVTPVSDCAFALMAGYPEDLENLHIAQLIKHEGIEYQLSLMNRPNLFDLLIEREYSDSLGKYNLSFAPGDNLYVMVKYERRCSPEVIIKMVKGFLFSLASAYDLVFTISPYIYFIEGPLDLLDEDTFLSDAQGMKTLRLRPVDTSAGMYELYSIYQNGCSAPTTEFKILSFYQILEFCSESWVRKRTYTEIDNLLCLPDALNPDANFIDKLIAVIRNQKEIRKQGNAIPMLIKECSDALELCDRTPACLELFKKINPDSNEKDKGKALDSLAECINATRNQLVHAKPSYEKTGKECPESEFVQLTSCLRIVALQAIRWYSGLREEFRVLKSSGVE